MDIVIAGRSIGPEHPVFIIAEAGVNHNGDVDLARKLVAAAAEGGSDCVKFQTWDTDKLVIPGTPVADYQAATGERDQYEMLRQLELRPADFRDLRDYAAALGTIFMSTPDDEGSADLLNELDVPAFKIGSGELTNLNLLRHVASFGRPMIISTGMSTLTDVERAVVAIEGSGNNDIIILHCVSQYPASPSDCNLRAIPTLARAFGYPVGFSDHTIGEEASLAAVTLGACVLEKHLTLDCGMKGPDHAASMEPDTFARYVASVRIVESALGDGRKRPTPGELATRKVVTRVIVAQRDLREGAVIANEDIALRRADGTIPSESSEFVIGRRTRRAITANEAIEWSMLE